jgi:hypothetical protein
MTALPHEHLERATAGLPVERQRPLLAADVHNVPLWDTVVVTGPQAFSDLRGSIWYEYRANVESRRCFDRSASVTPPRCAPAESR